MEREPCYFYFYSFRLHVIQAVADKYQIDTEDIRNVFKKTLGKERSVVVWIDDQYFPKIEGQSFLMKVTLLCALLSCASAGNGSDKAKAMTNNEALTTRCSAACYYSTYGET